MSKNILFYNFPRCYQLFDMKGLNRQHVELDYDPVSKQGQIMICYVYKGLYVVFYGELKKRDEYYKIQTRFKDFEEFHEISNSTVLDENIPGFGPIKIITKSYSLKRMMISAHNRL